MKQLKTVKCWVWCFRGNPHFRFFFLPQRSCVLLLHHQTKCCSFAYAEWTRFKKMCLSVYVTGLLVFLGCVFSKLVQDNLPKAKHPHLSKQGGIIWLHTISLEQKKGWKMLFSIHYLYIWKKKVFLQLILRSKAHFYC